MHPRLAGLAGAVILGAVVSSAAGEALPRSASLELRGHSQSLHLYGPPEGKPVLLSSGDGGWRHLGPEVAEMLSTSGYFVVGFDVKSYLSVFTSGTKTLTTADVPGDYSKLVEYARQGRSGGVLLVGVSEGAGLSVLAASNRDMQPLLAGVVGLGLPENNELGWRLRDSLIYVTHKTPDEPVFHTSDFASQLGSVPLAAIHSRRDEFVPVPLVQTILDRVVGPKRLWVIDAIDHRFSDRKPELQKVLFAALDWIQRGGR